MSRLPDYPRAVRLAYRVLAARQVNALPVDPLALLKACRDTLVLTCAEAAELSGVSSAVMERMFREVDALTFCREQGGSQYIVVYNPCGNPARLRFTLAHELGHRLLGGDEASEREADCFASHLLCPEPALVKLRERWGKLSAEQIAAIFYVSLPCARMVLRRGHAALETELQKAAEALFVPLIAELPLPKGRNCECGSSKWAE